MQRQRLAVSTGQAARYCFVTSDTILNWIKSGLIGAQRTAGGQYRILLDDLRRFMEDGGMSTELLDSEYEPEVFCWQFHAGRSAASPRGIPCDACIVKHLRALDCFKLMAMRPRRGDQRLYCADCEYFQRYGGGDFESDGEEIS